MREAGRPPAGDGRAMWRRVPRTAKSYNLFMSFKGVIEASCPNGCEPFAAEVWSFIHGGNSPELREAVAAKECNLLLCPGCWAPFFADAPYVYFEPAAEILAFVFPEHYRGQEPRWRRKMRDDFRALKQALGPRMPLDLEPEVFFGSVGLAEILSAEDLRSAEREVMECLAGKLGLCVYRVCPRFARRNGIPAALPFAPAPSEGATRANVIAGLERIVAANDRLAAYQSYLAGLRGSADAELPPPKS